MDGTTFGLGMFMTAWLWFLLMFAFTVLLAVAAVIDARSRRFPNALAAVMAVLALAIALVAALGRASYFAVSFSVEPVGDAALAIATLKRLAVPLACAAAACAALFAVELLWRRVRGAAGLGMGDIKLLFSLMLVSPARGIVAFAGGLVLLAVFCLVMRKRDLPLIPFITAVWVALLVARVAGI